MNNPLPFNKVRIDDQFWGPRINMNAKHTVRSQHEQLVHTGRLPAFGLDWKPGTEPVPHTFWDSDVAKWVEGACYTTSVTPDAEIEAMVDEAVNLIVSAQQPDGYLNVFYTVVEPENRWTNLRDCHELYCAGHLIEAAVAHFRATGKRDFLDAMCRYADYIDSVFGTEPGKKRGYCGHPELELALVKLYEATDNERYLRMSEYFVEEHGQQPYYFDVEAIARGEEIPCAPSRYDYAQANVPVREQTIVAGHAVRAMYFYSGAADIAGIRQDSGLYAVLSRLLNQLVTKRMYVTGGIGSSASNEGFTTDYDLPNQTAYAETCAAIGLIFWCQRMLRYDLDTQYADVMERALFNGAISGISLSGDKYFYENPLESNGKHHRVDWFGCACCPSNVMRLIASLGGYVYSHTDTDAIVHLYVQSEAEIELGGTTIRLRQETSFPWEDSVALTVRCDQPAHFGLTLRIPGWCDDAAIKVNGNAIDAAVARKGYIRIEREWRNGDLVEMTLPMRAKRVYAHPEVSQDTGKVALQRGPIVYCLEETDNPTQRHRILLPDDTILASSYEEHLLGGVVTIKADALCTDDTGWDGTLYRNAPPSLNQCRIKAVPYYAWDNRAPGWMCVWVNRACE